MLKNMELNSFQRLKLLRTTNNLSQKEVAEALEMTPSGYSLIETGKTKLNETHLSTLKDKFGFDIDFILQGKQANDSSDMPAWAEELFKRLDKLMLNQEKLIEMSMNQTGKALDLLGKKPGNYHTGLQVAYKAAVA
jgi:transcriptional regulator with XRE-family HTH domain